MSSSTRTARVILFQILDPLETQFPFRGLIEFRDMSEESLEVESEDCREGYLSDLNRYIQGMRRICGRRT